MTKSKKQHAPHAFSTDRAIEQGFGEEFSRWILGVVNSGRVNSPVAAGMLVAAITRNSVQFMRDACGIDEDDARYAFGESAGEAITNEDTELIALLGSPSE